MIGLTETFPWSAALGCLLVLSGWVAIHVGIRKVSGFGLRIPLFMAGLATAWVFAYLGIRVVDHFLDTTNDWPDELLALLGALAAETIVACYGSRPRRRWSLWKYVPLSLRLGLVALLIVILLEPTLSKKEEEEQDRYIALMLDESASMDLVDQVLIDGIPTDQPPRREIAKKLILDRNASDSSLLDALDRDFLVNCYRFGASAQQVKPDQWRDMRLKGTTDSKSTDLPSKSSTPKVKSKLPTSNIKLVSKKSNPINPWKKTTDTAAALRRIDNDFPLEELSGVVLVTDGCDHSQTDLQKAALRLVRHKVPICSVVVGNRFPVLDAKITSIQAPGKVFLGDKVTIKAAVSADEMNGQSFQVTLKANDEIISRKRMRTTSDWHRQTILFHHEPKRKGVCSYAVEIESDPREATVENNVAVRRVFVSDDRIRMLIVESRPRWEFRYLRNLFAGRDRSVHLQYVLIRPDRLAGVGDPPIMHASVTRAFDDYEATALPRNEAEWLKFDVIVLGDVAPDDLGIQAQRALVKFVKDRSGALIVIAGQAHMPHAFTGTPMVDLFPVLLQGARKQVVISPDQEYWFRLSSEARTHVVMQQASTPEGSQRIWDDLPSLYWRHPNCQAKSGATVLAYASDRSLQANRDVQAQRQNALILWHRFGGGKVLHLTFDQTWRLRYGVGSRYHHKFWGQILRWANADRLQLGTNLVRMGIDKATYKPHDEVTIRARLLDQNRNPVETQDFMVQVYLEHRLVRTERLIPEAQGSGRYKVKISDLTQPGNYRAVLKGTAVEQLLAIEGYPNDKVFAEFQIEQTNQLVEQLDVVARDSILKQLASSTGGKVVGQENALDILSALGPKSAFRRDQWVLPLWNLWPVIGLFLAIASTEWTVRKISGLI